MKADSYKHSPSTDTVYVRAVPLSTLARDWKPGYPDTRLSGRNERPMPADPVNVTPPEHALPRLATFELTKYRRELERALKRLPTNSEARPGLIGQLSEVLAEQESRKRIADASASRTSTHGL